MYNFIHMPARMNFILKTSPYVHLLFLVFVTSEVGECNDNSSYVNAPLCSIHERMCNDGSCGSIHDNCLGHGGSRCNLDEKFCPGIGCVYKSMYEAQGCQYGTCRMCKGGTCSDDGLCPSTRCPVGKKLCHEKLCYWEASDCSCPEGFSTNALICHDNNGCYEESDICNNVCDCEDCSDESCASSFMHMVIGIRRNLPLTIMCLSLAVLVMAMIISFIIKKRKFAKGSAPIYSNSATSGQTQQLLPLQPSRSLNPLRVSPRAQPRMWEANPDHLYYSAAVTDSPDPGHRVNTSSPGSVPPFPPLHTYGSVVSDAHLLLTDETETSERPESFSV